MRAHAGVFVLCYRGRTGGIVDPSPVLAILRSWTLEVRGESRYILTERGMLRVRPPQIQGSQFLFGGSQPAAK